MRRRLVNLQARAFARFVARAKPERLERIMAGRLRMPLLRRIFRAIPQRVKGEGGDREVIEIRVKRAGGEEPDVWQLALEGSSCKVSSGAPEAPKVTTTFEGVEFLRFAAGLRAGPELFMQGKLKVEGNMMLAARMSSRFAFPKP